MSSCVVASTNDLASFSSCLFKSASPCNISVSADDTMASNSCFRLFRLVVRLVSNSAFLVSVYKMKMQIHENTKAHRIKHSMIKAPRLRFLTSMRSVLQVISFSLRSVISGFSRDRRSFSSGVKWSMSSVPISACFMAILALSWSIWALTSASDFSYK